MKTIEICSIIPRINICRYECKGKMHYYLVLHWLFWHWTSLKEFE